MLQRDFDERLGDFAARPYFRAFVGFICELEPPEPVSAAQFGHLQVTAEPSSLPKPYQVIPITRRRQQQSALMVSDFTIQDLDRLQWSSR